MRSKVKLESAGIEKICELIIEGKSLTQIAKQLEVPVSTLSVWLADPERSVRAREARELVARIWDEKAEEEIDNAKNWFDLGKAKEKCFHYRWRASKIAPKEYGDKLALDHSGSLKIDKVIIEHVNAAPPTDG